MDKNKELHDLLGLPPEGHDVQGESCDHYYETWPDYFKNPLLVLEGMVKRDDWPKFVEIIGMTYWVRLNDVRKESATEIPHYTVDVELLQDTSGKFRDMAIAWLKGATKEEEPPPPNTTPYSRPECPFNYCDAPWDCEPKGHCRHK